MSIIKPKVFMVRLEIDYDIGNNETITLSQSSFDNTFDFDINDKEKNKFTDSTGIKFESIEELENILKHFKTEYSKIKPKK